MKKRIDQKDDEVWKKLCLGIEVFSIQNKRSLFVIKGFLAGVPYFSMLTLPTFSTKTDDSQGRMPSDFRG